MALANLHDRSSGVRCCLFGVTSAGTVQLGHWIFRWDSGVRLGMGESGEVMRSLGPARSRTPETPATRKPVIRDQLSLNWERWHGRYPCSCLLLHRCTECDPRHHLERSQCRSDFAESCRIDVGRRTSKRKEILGNARAPHRSLTCRVNRQFNVWLVMLHRWS